MNDVSTVRVAPAVLPKPNDTCWCGSGASTRSATVARTPSRPARGARRRSQGRAARHRQPAPRPCPCTSPARTTPDGGRPAAPPSRGEEPGRHRPHAPRRARPPPRCCSAVGRAVRPGITTDELDEIAHEAYLRRGGYPSTLELPRLPQVALHLGQRGRLPRHPRQPRAGGRRHRQPRRHRLPGRRARGLARPPSSWARWTPDSQRLVARDARVPGAAASRR